MQQHDNLPAIPARSGSQATTIEQSRAVAEVQAAILVALQFPRDMSRAQDEMRAACANPALASRAFYDVPNRGTGPTVHLMRELARIWGNVDYGVKELSRDDEAGVSEIQAFAWDQQTNVRSTRSFIVPHERQLKNGRRKLVDLGDIYLNNQNIGARAVRECIATVLPIAFTEEAKDLCQKTIERANGTGDTLQQNIAEATNAFAQLHVTAAQLEARVGKPQHHWDGADLGRLQVTYQSIRNGEVSVQEVFAVAPVTVQEINQEPTS